MTQALIKGKAGTIESYFLGARPTSCTVSLYTGEGATKIDEASATVDTVNTTTSASAARGATTISLTSATGVVVGRRYGIGAQAGSQPREVVMVKQLDSSVATLWAPTMYAHASASVFAGTRVSYSVTSTQADVLWWDGYADFTPDTGDVQTEVVDCVLRKIPDNLIDETDIHQIHPEVAKILSAKLDVPTALRNARDEFLRVFGGKNRAHCALGADHFRRPAALTFFIMLRYMLGPDWQAEIDLMEKERDLIIQKIESSIPFDNDQDGITTGANDGGFTTIQLSRA
jgi:hypothetical protein